MKRVAWLTDIHLNFLSRPALEAFLKRVRDQRLDAVLVTGDIGEAGSVVPHLEAMESRLQVPVYFVLGNHDFYSGSIAGVRLAVEELARRSTNLYWLPLTGSIELAPATGLLGHDGWADARLGDYGSSEVMLNDYLLIREFIGLGKGARRRLMQQLGDEAADYVRRTLPTALDSFRHVVLLTHPPPFREACWHEGRISADDWLPHFGCASVGEVLREIMGARPDRRLTVLCGHTHSPGEAAILPNLTVHTGRGVYGRPEVQRILEVD